MRSGDARDTTEIRPRVPRGGGADVRETGKPIAQVARDLGIHEGTLGSPRRAGCGGQGVLRRLGGNPGTYGSPRVWEDLVAAGWRVSKKTVAASMARQGLQGRSPKRKRWALTRPDKAAGPIPDLVKRDFNAETVDQRWCGDLTEIPTDTGKLYLATVLDLASRRLAGFAMSEHHDSALAKAALCMAAAVRGGDVHGVVFHSDKGGESPDDTLTARLARPRARSRTRPGPMEATARDRRADRPRGAVGMRSSRPPPGHEDHHEAHRDQDSADEADCL
jgi:transposase InsO family protein